VARWRVLNHWRSETRFRRALKASTLDLLDARFDREDASAPAWESHKAALARCLEGLGARIRRALEMRYVSGLPLARIAERLGKREGAVQMAMARSRDRLAECVRRSLSPQGSES
jgi:RNA polymerase sigma factor (sigma-70 family)